MNQGKKDINQIAEYFRPELAPYTEVAGKPAKPEITDFMDYDDDYGYGGVQFYLTRASEDGNYLNPSKLYYNMYLDEEKYTFYPNEYPKLTEDLTDVPYSYSGTVLVSYGDNHIVYFYTTGFNKLGIQVIYKDGDRRYESEIAWLDVANYLNIDHASVKGNALVVDVTYTDVMSRRVNAPVKGLYLKTATLADGTVITTKVVVK